MKLMTAMAYVYVSALLAKTFAKTLARQFYLKLTKFTRRSREPKAFAKSLAAGCEFLRDMWRYNWDVIRLSRGCLERLTEEHVQEVFVYGESDVREVLCDLTFAVPMKVKMLRDHYENENSVSGAVPLEVGAASSDKIIVASVVNVQERIRRLVELGVDHKRLILLD
jgi:hypothetical protein